MNKHELCPDVNNCCVHGEDESCPAFSVTKGGDSHRPDNRTSLTIRADMNAAAAQEKSPTAHCEHGGTGAETSPAPAAAPVIYGPEKQSYPGGPVYRDGVSTGAAAPERAPAHFANVFCSQCGRDFGPGDHGFSHCSDHTEPVGGMPESIDQLLIELDDRPVKVIGGAESIEARSQAMIRALRAHALALQTRVRELDDIRKELCHGISLQAERAETKLREAHELDRHKLHNAFTEVIAQGLHYLENFEKIVGLQSAQEVIESIDGGIKRYTSDVAYRAKVQRIVAPLMTVLAARREKEKR